MRATSVAGSDGITFMARSSVRSSSVTIIRRSSASSASSSACRSCSGSGATAARVQERKAGSWGSGSGYGQLDDLGVDLTGGLGPVHDLAHRVGAGDVEVLEGDALEADRHQAERAVGVGLDVGHLDPAADPEQRLRAVLADLVTLADADRPEVPLLGVHTQQVVDQRAVAVLEHGEGHADAREQDRVEREHRQRRRHGSTVTPGCSTARHRGRVMVGSLLDSGVMMRRIDLRGATPAFDYRAAVPRADFDVEAAEHVVRPICEAVRTRGLEAVLELNQK